MKGRFMRDLRQCWLDITPAPIPSQKNQIGRRSSQSIHPQRGSPHGHQPHGGFRDQQTVFFKTNMIFNYLFWSHSCKLES